MIKEYIFFFFTYEKTKRRSLYNMTLDEPETRRVVCVCVPTIKSIVSDCVQT